MTHRPASALLRLLALLAAFGLLAAACGDDDSEDGGDTETEAPADDADDSEDGDDGDDTGDGDSEQATTTTASPDDDADGDGDDDDDGEGADGGGELTASFKGVSADTITVAVTMLDFQFLVDNNFSTEGWGDQQLVWQTFIDDLNSRGGINGRQVEVGAYEFYSPIGTTEAEAACLRVTQDIETFAVLGGFVGPAELANSCVTGSNETLMVGGRQDAERLAQSSAPWLQGASTRERSLPIFIQLLDDNDMLRDKTIAIIGSVELQAIFDGSEDLVKDAGGDVVLVAENDAPQGEILAEDARWDVLAEAIDAAGADAVLIIGGGQAAVRGIARSGLDIETWVLDVDSLSNLGTNTPKEDADGAITVSGLSDQERWDDALTQECRDIFFAANPELEAEVKAPEEIETGEEAWFNSILNYCQFLRIFENVATAAGPNLTYDSFEAALDDPQFDQFSLPWMPFGSLGSDKFDANDSFRLLVFDADASETGDVVPLTEIQDGTP